MMRRPSCGSRAAGCMSIPWRAISSRSSICLLNPAVAMIFISYRKADTQDKADYLALELKRHFGETVVFKDDTNLRPGYPWPDRLRDAMLSCQVLLAVIGEKWLTIGDK